ncbi:MAG: general secretion pathway protein GspB [Desulforhopalus sp.]
MSYILDALKKSDQERQQGNLPHLHSAHGPLLQSRGSSSILKQQYIPWLIFGGVLLLIISLGILFIQYRQIVAEKESIKTTETVASSAEQQVSQQPPDPAQSSTTIAENTVSSSPQVMIRDQHKVPENPVSVTVQGYPESPTGVDTTAQTDLPLLKDLPAGVQAEVPNLEYAGHTYSQNPSHRMIIVNGKILREGSLIAPNIYLREITWEGLIIESNGTRFRVQTN